MTNKKMTDNTKIILASGSPRRKELLSQAGLDFSIEISDVDETVDTQDAEKTVKELAERKADAVAKNHLRGGATGNLQNEVEENMQRNANCEQGEASNDSQDKVNSKEELLIVSADTVVALDNHVIGKPKDEEDALKILMSLSGKTHDVYTGVCCISMLDGNVTTKDCFVVRTAVTMYDFDESEALEYIASGEPMDKAGAYGIQGIGARLVEKIDGDYNNVVGFPLATFLRRMGKIELNGKLYKVEKLLGKGKGGYSFLVSEDEKNYVLKQIHHEPCSYYQFGDKIQSELNDYKRLKEIGIRLPLMLDVDVEKERILKEYIEGSIIYDLVLNDQMKDEYVQQMKDMCQLLYPAKTNIDYFPTNFVVQGNEIYYIDYECNNYMEEWNFENWGIKYWSKTPEFIQYVENHK